ncbi:MAG: HNH endonuclease [Betaproteobacteria bacterium]|nr:HNH endonuclease [Betaproteobacteria bacterium]
MQPLTPDDLAARLLDEQAKARKMEIIFGVWWRHYAVPYEFAHTLYAERSSCPYCGGALGPFYLPAEGSQPSFIGRAQIDHMDPLSLGGEESIRNAVYVCDACNMAKGRRMFTAWLDRLNDPHKSFARQLYVAKHGHEPEAFQRARKQSRLTLPRRELLFDESVLRQLFPTPIVSGPPERRR